MTTALDKAVADVETVLRSRGATAELRDFSAELRLILNALREQEAALRLVPLSTEWSCMEPEVQDAVLAALTRSEAQ